MGYRTKWSKVSGQKVSKPYYGLQDKNGQISKNEFFLWFLARLLST